MDAHVLCVCGFGEEEGAEEEGRKEGRRGGGEEGRRGGGGEEGRKGGGKRGGGKDGGRGGGERKDDGRRDEKEEKGQARTQVRLGIKFHGRNSRYNIIRRHCTSSSGDTDPPSPW